MDGIDLTMGEITMGVWDWITKFNKEVKERGDTERQRLYALHQEAMKHDETEPERTMVLLRQGRQLAESLNEPRWVLFFDHWILQKMLSAGEHLDEYLAIAVRATVEVSKPEFGDFPQRFCLQDDLIRGYMRLGSLAFPEQIEAALAFMEKEVTPDLECAMCTLGKRFAFEVDMRRYESAEAAVYRKLQLAETKKDDHYKASSYSQLCWLATRRDNFSAIEPLALAGEEAATRKGKKKQIAEFGMWRAVAARANGDDAAARRLFRASVARMGRLKNPDSDYYDAWCRFHELAGDYANALKIRDRQVAQIRGAGRFEYEWDVQLARCRLLARLGKLHEADIAAARAIAQHIRKPEAYLPDLERILAGDLSL